MIMDGKIEFTQFTKAILINLGKSKKYCYKLCQNIMITTF
ncbi:hypothetical protein BVAVS116_H0115 (plasmid) [Borreliella valaisiana VS116]|uniref:Uncharacterized protein n=1 Tax=Borreliella valaisiana VS116 TaxID=445987 RepID=C0R930_BORVA|nr:hypothetical protein BVAVS116_H0115 [Borreliella valaisiana VS116]